MSRAVPQIPAGTTIRRPSFNFAASIATLRLAGPFVIVR
jgi:hypothetical protein